MMVPYCFTEGKGPVPIPLCIMLNCVLRIPSSFTCKVSNEILHLKDYHSYRGPLGTLEGASHPNHHHHHHHTEPGLRLTLILIFSKLVMVWG